MDNIIKNSNWSYLGNGYEFEDIITNLLQTILQQSTQFKLTFTKSSNDGAIDALIEYDKDFEWLNYIFTHDPYKNENLKCYIHVEIKHRTNKLSANDIKKYTTKKNSNYYDKSYQIVITDNFITPNVHAEAITDSKRCGFEFILIDKLLLLQLLNEYRNFHDINLSSENDLKQLNTFHFYHNIDDLKQKVDSKAHSNTLISAKELNIQLYNLSKQYMKINIILFNDLNIKCRDNETNYKTAEVIIPPMQIVLKSFTLSTFKKDIEKLSVDFNNNQLSIIGNVCELQFEPNLFGKEHLLLLEKLTLIQKNESTSIIYLHGTSGVGKSKILQDLHINNIFKFSKNNTFANFLEKNNIDSLEDYHSRNRFEYIVFDDIHLADKNFFENITNYCNHKKTKKNHTKLLLVGRDDYTYEININYEKFQYQSKNNKSLINLELKSWSEKECREFLNNVILDLPKAFEDKIVKLSENKPLWVIHSVKYLIDESLLTIYNRALLGIVNLEMIGSKDYIPKEIEKLLDYRFKHISDKYEEIPLLPLLISLSYIDTVFDFNKFNKLYNITLEYKKNIYTPNIILEDLVNKSFLKKLNNDTYEFSHENIYLYLIEKVEKDKYKKIIGDILIQYFEKESLNEKEIGYLYYLKNDYNKACENFKTLIDLVNEKAENISSIDIDSENLKYLRPAYMSLYNLGKNSIVIKILKVRVHLSTHLEHLKKSLDVATSALKFIDQSRNKLGDITDIEILRFSIKQQYAHSTLNLGHVSYSKSLIENLLAEIEIYEKINILADEQKKELKKIKFDSRDRLQNIYHQLNNRIQFYYNSLISEELAEKDTKLLALVKSSRVKEFYYSDPIKHYELTKSATKSAKENKASKRHLSHANLNLYIAELLIIKDEEAIKRIQRKLEFLLKEAKDYNYTFSITRASLAIATTYALLGLNKKENIKLCDKYCNQCIESIIEYGNGFFKWQVYNLKAIISIAKNPNHKKEANGYFLTCIDILKKQGILNLTNFDLLSVNLSVITNYFIFIKGFYNSKSLMYWFFKKLEYNNKCYEDEEKEFEIKIIESIEKYDFIGISSDNKKILNILKEPFTGYNLALR